MQDMVISRADLGKKILKWEQPFAALTLEVFAYQYAQNDIYQAYCKHLNAAPNTVKSISDIPFLPISFFKTHQPKTGQWDPVKTFSSSGTSGQTTSFHQLREEAWYQQVSLQGFEKNYGPITDYAILGLLPAYLEREGSSLTYMVDYFMKCSQHPANGFYLYDHQALLKKLKGLSAQNQKVLLIGVSFALLDMPDLTNAMGDQLIVMETGGMKGRKKEITRTELHHTLSKKFKVEKIHSEYGMTELLSQAWSLGDGIYTPSDTMRVFGREINDPFHTLPFGQLAALNICDLGNVDSCSFIATDDLGRVYKDGTFEVLGRLDGSDIRGCNLMIGEEG